ncbi:MAG: peptidylprolyl isomerase [Bacteroides sp. SM23_62_1]|nr:MAG: peptidylprolyl isomerase [Bacteroides sp. SM23_62_1]
MNTPMEEINYEALTKGIQDIFTNQELIINPYEANMLFTDYLYKLQNVQYMANLEEGEEYLEKNKARKDVVSLPSGLQYRIIREGTGPRPALTDNVSVHYHGMLIDGTVFDSSVERGEPVTFPVNGVIDGWKEALQLMPVGSKWEVFIPNDLAYGARPPQGTSIEPYMVLIFEIELLSIEEAQN